MALILAPSTRAMRSMPAIQCMLRESGQKLGRQHNVAKTMRRLGQLTTAQCSWTVRITDAWPISLSWKRTTGTLLLHETCWRERLRWIRRIRRINSLTHGCMVSHPGALSKLIRVGIHRGHLGHPDRRGLQEALC